jgi:monomeric sarcosine oxidase
MTTAADLIIVGAGLAGSAAAWSATARGLDVVLLEAFGPGHKNGSSHGSARIFRRAYPDPLYVRLTGRAEERWRQLEDQAGERLLTLTGGVDFGAGRDPRALHAVLASCGVPAELLTAAAAGERWPYFDFAGVDDVMYHPDAGVLDPEHAMAAMLRLAEAGGAGIKFGTPVTRLERTSAGDGAVAHTDSGSFTAPVAVVAAGAWTAPLLDGVLSLPTLTVTQQQVSHFAPVTVPEDSWPVFIYQGSGNEYFGLPGGRDGEVPGAIKIGEHTRHRPTTAADRDFVVDPAVRDRVAEFIASWLPGLISDPVNEVTCLYTSTANEDFVLDRSGPFVLASPCSGHGAKFAPLLGEIIADLATGAPAPDPRFTIAAHRAT